LTPAPESPTASRSRLALTALVLAILTVALFARVRDHEFVAIDDESYITENVWVLAGWTTEGVRWAFTTPHSSNWHPLTSMSHMLDVELFGTDAGSHHLMSTGLHALGAAVLFLALVALTRRYWPSLVVAALFAVHPLHVESVAWASERKDVLSGLFWMLTLLAYAGYARRPSVLRYAAVFVALALGLMAKPMLVTLPFVLLLLDAWPLGRLRFVGEGKTGGSSAVRLVAEKLPLLALATASSVVTAMVQASSGSTRSLEAVPGIARATNAIVAYGQYLWKSLWPSDLAVFYPHPAITHPDSLGGLYVAAGVVGVLLVAITGLAVRGFRRAPYLAVGWLWFLGTLVPVIGLLQVGMQAWADRYAYLPTIGIYVIAVWGIADLARRRERTRVVAPVLAVVAVGVYSTIAWFQVGKWRDSRTLFEHAIEVTEDNHLAWGSMGVDSLRRNDLGRAARELEEAIRIKPDYIHAMNNLGVTMMRQGRPEEGFRHMQRAVRIAPNNADARSNFGLALLNRGDADGAIEHLEVAIRIDPQRAESRFNLGLALISRGDLDRARAELEAAVRINPGFAPAHGNLGGIHVQQGRWDLAEKHLREALRLHPGLVNAWFNMGMIHIQRGRAREARSCFERVLSLAPEHAGARAQLQALRGQ